MINGPKNAVPTLRGWVSPKGELLKVQKITQEQIDEWYGVSVQTATSVVETAEVVVESQDEESVETGTEVTEDNTEEEVETSSVSLPKVSKVSTLRKRIKKKLTGN
jgi:hypothetical protein